MRTRHCLVLGFLVATVLALPSRLLMGANVWTIPGTVNAAGQNNTRFVSDLAATNPGGVPAQLTISLVPPNGTTPSQVVLAAGETVVYRNLLDRVWGAQGSGATQVSSDAPLLIRARTYNTAASGTYGVALPVFADDRLLSNGETAHSLWVSQSAAGGSGYRTNVAVTFPDEGGGSATVTIFDADGNQAGQQSFSMDSAGFQQVSVGGFAGAVPVGRARIVVTRGRAAGYSVVVDNVTGDSSLFTFEALPEGVQDVLVNGVARANGKNNTFFRTDGRFYNPGPEETKVTVAFHANQGNNPSPVTADFIVPAGRTRDVVDVLDSLLGLPVGSAGALRFSSELPVAILCRTSNVDPSGAKPGTYGAQQKPAPLLSFLMSADAGAVVTGIRQNATFRTNIGFAAGGEGAEYSLTLKNTSGTTVATATGSLGAFGWSQRGVDGLFPGTTIPDDATLVVKVTSGSVDVFDSSIDNASGDSVVTPVMPLPVDTPSAATIGPLGGSIRSSDGRVTLKVPAGALASGVAVSLTAVDNDAPGGTGSAYTLAPGSLAFSRPATLVLAYATSDVLGADSGALGLAYKLADGWHVAGGGSVNPAAHTLSVPISSAIPPSSAKTGARTVALDDSPLWRWAPFRSRYLYPKKTAVALQGKRILGVIVVGPSSSDGGFVDSILNPSVDPKKLTYAWYIDGLYEVGTISNHDNTAVYHAPQCLPPENPVKVGVEILDLGGSFLPSRRRMTLEIPIKVIPHFWEVKVDLGQFETCDSGVAFAHREDWKGAKINFVVEDDVVVDPATNPRLLISHPPEFPTVAVPGVATKLQTCPFYNCAYVLDPTIDEQLTDVTGAYYIDGDFLQVVLSLNGGVVGRLTSPGYFSYCGPGEPGYQRANQGPLPPMIPFNIFGLGSKYEFNVNWGADLVLGATAEGTVTGDRCNP